MCSKATKSCGFISLVATCLFIVPSLASAEVTTHIHHDSDIPVATAVEIPSDHSVIYLSGKLPKQQNASSSSTNPYMAYGGDTKAQAISVLKDIENTLGRLGLRMEDIVKVQVYLVGDPKLNNFMDTEGFSEAYGKFFSKKMKNLPSRTLVQVSNLAKPGMLVEIEVTAVRKK
ncbi:2-iminobutanoate/2-iminopropanoate deaminase [Acinetobacter calcoaceticus]|jgi:enamine deaminase RidA (YjgF/YER057c/UK114 family)|nr:2-iminobutanoate/2-iminopropanoate deaminase [Acinetobacter calcoaceticus]